MGKVVLTGALCRHAHSVAGRADTHCVNTPQGEPTWQDYADDLYRTKRQRPWGRIAAACVVLALAGTATVALARPMVSGEQQVTEPGSLVRDAVTNAQQQMEIARLSGDGTYVAPFPDNPHRGSDGITITVCWGVGNSTYTITAYRTAGEYFNATSKLPGAVSGPEATATCAAGG